MELSDEQFDQLISRAMDELPQKYIRGLENVAIIYADDPTYLSMHDFWQVRLIFEVRPLEMAFSAGEDGDEVAFMDAAVFKDSASAVERKIYDYVRIASQV